MSDVWLAEDTRLGRWVAIKLLKDVGGIGEDDRSIDREARLIASLAHPNIVAVYDAGRHDGRPYLVMEYVHGATLREILAQRRTLTESEAVRFGAQVASALAYAHAHGIVHCDVKPENILITDEGVAKAVDFGVGRTLTRTMTPDEARAILGTIAYLAPEVLQGSPPDPRSDIYSLALTVYEMVAGRLPFGGVNLAASAGQRLAATAPPLRSFSPEASPELERILARALAFAPEARFQDAEEFAAALRRLPGEPRPAPIRRAPAPQQPHRPASARPGAPRSGHNTARARRAKRGGPNVAALVAIAGGFALAVGAGIAAAVVWTRDREDSSPVPTPTPETATVAPTPTVQASPTPTPSPVPSPSPSRSPSPTPARSPSPSASASPSPTLSPTPTRTPSPSPQAPPTPTPQP